MSFRHIDEGTYCAKYVLCFVLEGPRLAQKITRSPILEEDRNFAIRCRDTVQLGLTIV